MDQLDPKNYASYEDYLEALYLQERFLDLSQKATKALRGSKTEEEYNQKMEALGFTLHQDEYCDRSFCQDNETCLWIMMEAFQEDSNRYFFDGLLAEKDLMFSKTCEGGCCGNMCQFPESWTDEKNASYQSMIFVLDVEDAVYASRSRSLDIDEFRKRPDVRDIFRNLYLFLLIQLKEPRSSKRKLVTSKIKAFLKKNKLLSSEVAEEFHERFNKIIGTPIK